MSSVFHDRRASKLLSRVREDVATLREDIATLLSHTTQNTVPRGARQLSDQARTQLAAGGAYAASRLRHLRREPASHTAEITGGALLFGLIAAGAAWYLYKNGCCSTSRHTANEETETEAENRW